MKLLQIGIPALFFLLLWLLLSGHYDPFHIGLGVFSVILVVAATWKLSIIPKGELGNDIWTVLYTAVRWRHGLLYPFVLALNILKANFQVAALVLDPRMPIDPILMRFKTTYETDAAKIILGNSITLTPGTVTLDIQDKEFFVHALSPGLASSLIDGSDQDRVAKVFGESLSGKPKVLISRDLEELQK
jgi:multicomponent Na+:H+ antiporter subunit E